MKKTIFGILLITMFALVSCGGNKTSALNDNSVSSQSSSSVSSSTSTQSSSSVSSSTSTQSSSSVSNSVSSQSKSTISSSSIHEHTYSSYWSSDDEYHWHTSTCGHDLISEKIKHVYKSEVTNPTFDNQGFTTYTCTICGHSYTSSYTDKLKHSFESTWESDSNSHWHACTDEGYNYLKSDKGEHKYVDNVVKSSYEERGYTTHTCEVCGYSYTDSYNDKLTHKYSDNWSYDVASHWHVCLDEGYEHLRKDVSTHVFEKTIIDPTYDSKGYTLYSCKCGYSYKDNITDQLIKTYTITWTNWDGTVLETDVVEEGKIPSYDGETPTRESSETQSYVFSGWSPKISEATSDQTYVATFEKGKDKYVISFDLNGGTSSSYDGSKTVEFFDKSIFFFDVTKENSNFRGWSYNGKKIFDETGKLLDTPEMEGKMTFVAMFADTVKMSITKNMTEAGTVNGDGEYQYNSNVDISAHPYQGYKFVGWYYQGFLLSTTENYNYIMWDKDITIEARFELDSFKMTIKSNDEEYGLVLLKTGYNDVYRYAYTENLKYNNSITISAFSRTEVRFLGWYDENNNLVSTNAVYSFTMPNHDYTLEAKWNHFKIKYELNGGINSEDNKLEFTIDDEITLFDAKDKPGYTFDGWYNGNEKVTTIPKGSTKNITLTAKWDANKQNLVVNSSDTTLGTVDIISGSGYSDESITVKATPIDDSVFKGWYNGNTKVSNDLEYTFTMPTKSLTLTAKFISKCDLGMTPSISDDGKTLTYGLYPQTHVSDATTITALDSLTTTESNGWYEYNNEYYTKVSAYLSSSNYITFSDGTEIEDGTSYWFKCEPITWKILESDNGEYTLVSNVLLDRYRYNEYYKGTKNGYYANNYANSEIRTWLNNEFYNTAFNLDNSLIQTTEVDNSASTTDTYSTSNPYVCDNTNDKVYLLSYADYHNTNYFTDYDSRTCQVTDYAIAKGVYIETSTRNGLYWTRSPYSSNSYHAWNVGGSGIFDYDYVSSRNNGVRPALTIKIA